ncbi:uncharacterized protein LOC127932415 [Oncorhynchus keta]|uniref:uncharacterized protein LOC127932415 n=1 Tax=Oncorhynchus keta TaxID=8018 RepID=UPI00227BCD4A|nr:uncharacterized protein LOC127932415 [Oncorhynchus keta]
MELDWRLSHYFLSRSVSEVVSIMFCSFFTTFYSVICFRGGLHYVLFLFHYFLSRYLFQRWSPLCSVPFSLLSIPLSVSEVVSIMFCSFFTTFYPVICFRGGLHYVLFLFHYFLFRYLFQRWSPLCSVPFSLLSIPLSVSEVVSIMFCSFFTTFYPVICFRGGLHYVLFLFHYFLSRYLFQRWSPLCSVPFSLLSIPLSVSEVVSIMFCSFFTTFYSVICFRGGLHYVLFLFHYFLFRYLFQRWSPLCSVPFSLLSIPLSVSEVVSIMFCSFFTTFYPVICFRGGLHYVLFLVCIGIFVCCVQM